MRALGWLSLGLFLCSSQAACGGDETLFAASAGTGGGGGMVTGSTSSGSMSSTGQGGGGGSGGAGGQGGGGPSCPPAGPFTGKPIDAPDHAWTWVPVPGARCRDGSEAGFGVRRNPASSKVFIYLEGGGACFNGATCGINPGAFGALAFEGWKGTLGLLGIFDTAIAENPVKDWSAVYVPYCTGDIHGGDGEAVDVPGFGNPQNQDFVGYKNVDLFLQRLVPTFASATQVLLTGISAGGFGAAYNYDHVASAFCPVPVTLLDDSGPPMADAYMTPCLQKQWRDLWHLDATLPQDCADCGTPDGGGLVNYITYIGKKWPNSRLGLISSTKDSTISLFFGFGSNGCGVPVPLSGATYAAGLADLRANYFTAPDVWGTYYVDSTLHTYLGGPSFYTTSVKGKKLTAWVGEMLAGQASHVGP